MNYRAYLRLARLDKPVGILLLWAPTAWALWIANGGFPSVKLFLIFLFGTFVMRSAGCVINDIADREIDIHVKRTKTRPLTTGEVSLFEASSLLVFFLLCAFLLLWQLPWVCFPYAFAALVVTVVYPFCKRFLKAPQLVLGIAFSMGIPMAYVASEAPFDHAFWALCVINFLWILAYDTQYAMADRKDDLRIGVKSLAIYLGQWDKLIVNLLLGMVQLLWLILAIHLDLNGYFYIAWVVGLVVLTVEYRLLAHRKSRECLQAFHLNVWYGLVLWLGLICQLDFLG